MALDLMADIANQKTLTDFKNFSANRGNDFNQLKGDHLPNGLKKNDINNSYKNKEESLTEDQFIKDFGDQDGEAKAFASDNNNRAKILVFLSIKDKNGGND